MKETTLLYLEDFTALETDAQIVEIQTQEDRDVLILDKTIFYPQGGGQPYDTGTITGSSGSFAVEEVRFLDGIVHHIGRWSGKASTIGETVHCSVEGKRRSLHSRIHSAGHVIDMAVHSLNLSWVPGKGYHFPEGPYVEYSGILDSNSKEKTLKDIERVANEFVTENRSTSILFMEKEKMSEVCHHVPDYIPEHKPGRVVMYGDFGIPCGGTHVSNLGDIQRITIRKIKNKGEIIRVSYQIPS